MTFNPTYLAFAGTELADNHRTLTYLRGPNVAAAMGECNPVVTPTCGCAADNLGPYAMATDDVPWDNGTYSDWRDFLGMILLQTVGLDTAPLSRQVSNNLGAGGTLGRLALGPRTMAFRGLLFAKSSCGMDYGKRWLTEALTGQPCDFEHKGELCARTCCPPGEVPSEVGLRHMFLVGMLGAPTFTPLGRNGACCDHLVQVDWTMAAESPWMFDDLTADGTQTLATTPVTCFAWCDNSCPEPAADSACSADDPPDAYCEPWQRTPVACFTVPAQSDWDEATLRIVVDSGAGPLDRLILKVYENPTGAACPDADPAAWQCVAPCNVIEVRGLPTSSTLVLDGRTQRATLICPGGATTVGDPYVVGQKGLLSWQDVGCVALCVCAYAAASDQLAANVTVTVEHAARVLA